MSAPKFAVGEEVTIIAGEGIEFEAVIADRVYGAGTTESGKRISETYVYFMASPPPGYDIDPAMCGWAEMFLRKKHRPADESFHELMDSLTREGVVA